MSTKIIKQFLSSHLHELIGFSYALSGDMSSCEDSVTDSLLAYSFEKEIDNFDEPKNRDAVKEISKLIFGRHLSKKGLSIEEKSLELNPKERFFLLSDFERAICFLKYRMSLDATEIGHIIDMNSYEVISALSNSRLFLTESELHKSNGELL